MSSPVLCYAPFSVYTVYNLKDCKSNHERKVEEAQLEGHYWESETKSFHDSFWRRKSNIWLSNFRWNPKAYFYDWSRISSQVLSRLSIVLRVLWNSSCRRPTWFECKLILLNFVLEALLDVGFRLVGPFEILHLGSKEPVKNGQWSNYYRFYHDPPEFVTVIICTTEQYHIGYFR